MLSLVPVAARHARRFVPVLSNVAERLANPKMLNATVEAAVRMDATPVFKRAFGTTTATAAKPTTSYETKVRFIKNVEATNTIYAEVGELPSASVSDFPVIEKDNGYTAKVQKPTPLEEHLGAVRIRFLFKATVHDPVTNAPKEGYAITEHTYSGKKRNDRMDLVSALDPELADHSTLESEVTTVEEPGAKTPIHTHLESCTTVVLSVTPGFKLTDEFYTASEDRRNKVARFDKAIDRPVGSTTCDIVPENEQSCWAHRIVFKPEPQLEIDSIRVLLDITSR